MIAKGFYADPFRKHFLTIEKFFFEFAVASSPDDPGSALNMALVCQHLRKAYFEADRWYRRALSLDPCSNAALRNYSDFLRGRMPGGPYRPRAPNAHTLARGVPVDPYDYPERSGVASGLWTEPRATAVPAQLQVEVAASGTSSPSNPDTVVQPERMEANEDSKVTPIMVTSESVEIDVGTGSTQRQVQAALNLSPARAEIQPSSSRRKVAASKPLDSAVWRFMRDPVSEDTLFGTYWVHIKTGQAFWERPDWEMRKRWGEVMKQREAYRKDVRAVRAASAAAEREVRQELMTQAFARSVVSMPVSVDHGGGSVSVPVTAGIPTPPVSPVFGDDQVVVVSAEGEGRDVEPVPDPVNLTDSFDKLVAHASAQDGIALETDAVQASDVPVFEPAPLPVQTHPTLKAVSQVAWATQRKKPIAVIDPVAVEAARVAASSPPPSRLELARQRAMSPIKVQTAKGESTAIPAAFRPSNYRRR